MRYATEKYYILLAIISWLSTFCQILFVLSPEIGNTNYIHKSSWFSGNMHLVHPKSAYCIYMICPPTFPLASLCFRKITKKCWETVTYDKFFCSYFLITFLKHLSNLTLMYVDWTKCFIFIIKWTIIIHFLSLVPRFETTLHYFCIKNFVIRITLFDEVKLNFENNYPEDLQLFSNSPCSKQKIRKFALHYNNLKCRQIRSINSHKQFLLACATFWDNMAPNLHTFFIHKQETQWRK